MMTDTPKENDRRPCAPCADCGADLYETYWGGYGWLKMETSKSVAHGPGDCVIGLRNRLRVVHTIYKALIARGGNALTYGEWAQIGDAVDPIPGLPVLPACEPATAPVVATVVSIEVDPVTKPISLYATLSMVDIEDAHALAALLFKKVTVLPFSDSSVAVSSKP